MSSRREREIEREIAALPDLDVESDFARHRNLAEAKGTPQGIDPVTGERAAVTYRQLFNETGDEGAAREIFEEVKRAGGYGDVEIDQALDIRSLGNSVKAHKRSAEEGRDFRTGKPLDKYDIHNHKQAAQHQDNLVNAVGEALRRLERG